jgi:hypothetical protein
MAAFKKIRIEVKYINKTFRFVNTHVLPIAMMYCQRGSRKEQQGAASILWSLRRSRNMMQTGVGSASCVHHEQN